MSQNKPEWSHFHEACELLSYCKDDNVFTIVFRNEADDDVIIDFPLHEDFLDAFLLYRKSYKEYINQRLNE